MSRESSLSSFLAPLPPSPPFTYHGLMMHRLEFVKLLPFNSIPMESLAATSAKVIGNHLTTALIVR